MALEIERKFLIDLNSLGPLPQGIRIVQGYIPTQGKTAVRIRLKGEQAFLTIKGENRGAVRSEFEYPIPVDDADAMLAELCNGQSVDKIRYLIDHAGHTWEVDIFSGNNQGLIVAEVELDSENESVALPDWVREEVTGDPRYYNSSLISHPYSGW
ncbi:CYTH domain-containing protein [Aliamphritea hakodatensis]|uniref:CYTH domain-containing protein n=1 Tax=Aliamphritea hakodatensis TaxID=2895352 RepID=UPI0022FD9F21|nr:CYTH domain-containing protein [Aliamphritea hakodatensis]